MKKLLLTALLCLGLSAMAQTNTNPPIIPTLPDDSSTWSDEDVFFAGMSFGFCLGAISFKFRVVRQTANKEPII
jgi:hypothetical protein